MVKFKTKAFLEYLTIYTVGAVVYSFCEIGWRGYTHWTMSFAGGLCMALIYISVNKHPNRPLWLQCVEGCLTITAVEFIIGYIVNYHLNWNVWDYSSLPFNIMGLVCPLYTALWFVLSIPAVFLSKIFKTKIFKNHIDGGIILNGETKEEL